MSDLYEIIVPDLPQQIQGLVCEEIEGENTYFYIHQEQGTTITLNATASAIFDMCDGQTTIEAIAQVIADTLDVNFDEASRDTHMVLEELTGFGFITAQ
ncbi:MAG: PqqD family protein [Ghiorsea sp.]|nr:PqqD family protein [Ghiorsea sp.]